MYNNKYFYKVLFILSLISIFLISFYIQYIKYYNKLNVNINKVPYISTYYIKPIVKTNEDVVINFYITDYDQKEYKKESNSSYFTVTIKIDGKKDIKINHIPAGDNSITIGRFLYEGEQKFSIMCTDKYGRNSHELFNCFLVENSTNNNEYIMTTDDLSKYGIANSNNNSLALSTIYGLQALLDDKKAEGYNKLLLLPGIYVIDPTKTLYIPNEFTLDLNTATIKLKGFTGDSALMISLNNTFNSHVINGIIEGDYYEHDYKNSPNNSEWVNGISIEGESKYSSFENITVKNITGYGGTNGISNSKDNSISYIYANPIPISEFKLGDIDRKYGVDINSDIRTSSDFINISNYSNIDYLTISKYLGYQGNSCDTWNLICHFYDQNRKYITSIDGYQYRAIGIPANSKYIRVTLLGVNFPTDLSIQLFRVPTHCSFKNIKFENCRAVGLAQFAMKDMLVENCEFINCGQTLAKCAYDAEDGWDMMQDVTFRNLNFHDNPNNDFLTCAGHNFTIENMINGKIHIWDRTNSYVIRSCQNITSAYLGRKSRIRTGYIRFYDNSIKNGIIVDGDSNENWSIIIKDCNISGRADSTSLNDSYLRCDIGPDLISSNSYSNSLGTGSFIDCNIHDKNGSHNYGGNYDNCTLTNINGNFQQSFNFNNCTISNMILNASGEEDSYTFTDCNMSNFQINFGYWFKGAKILINTCTIENENYLIKLPQYSLSKSISIINNTFKSSSENGMIYFYDDRENTNYNSCIKLYTNIIDTPNSKYIINGLENTLNNYITIKLKNNNILSVSKMYNSKISSYANIKIEETN